MYMRPADDETVAPIAVGSFQSVVLVVLALLTVLLGVLPGLITGIL
jgi:NADH-quinone oxidoreductase subunit N